MAVNRQLRDELADALLRWARGEWTREQLRDVARNIRHQLNDATDQPAVQDEACHEVAYLLDERYYPVDTDPRWNRSFWRKMRQCYAFLRSDLSRNKSTSEEKTSILKRRLYLLWVDISIILTIVVIWKYGFSGILVWPLTSLPMWSILLFSICTDHAKRAFPFATKMQRNSHEHLADQPPAFPDFKTARRAHTVPKKRSMKKVLFYIVASPLVLLLVPLGILCYVAMAGIVLGLVSWIWPLVSKQWYRESVSVELSAQENPSPCDQCRRMMFESKVSQMIVVEHPVPMMALHQCPTCGTYWCGQYALSRPQVQKQFSVDCGSDPAI